MSAPTTSHAALVAEVTALRATLNDAVELCEDLRADRDALRAALSLIADADYGTDTPKLRHTARAALGRSA